MCYICILLGTNSSTVTVFLKINFFQLRFVILINVNGLVTSEITNQKYREDTCICRHRKQTLSLAGTKHGILAAVANWAPYISKATFLEPQQLRERPFNLWFFSKKIFWFPMLLKIIFWFWWRKKKSDSEFLSYNLMLNSGKKIVLCATKTNKYSNSRVVRKKIFERNKKP